MRRFSCRRWSSLASPGWQRAWRQASALARTAWKVAFLVSFQLPLAAYGAGLLPAAAYGGGFPGLAAVAVVGTGFVSGHPAGFIRGAVGLPFVGIGHGAALAFVFCRGAATAIGPVHYGGMPRFGIVKIICCWIFAATCRIATPTNTPTSPRFWHSPWSAAPNGSTSHDTTNENLRSGSPRHPCPRYDGPPAASRTPYRHPSGTIPPPASDGTAGQRRPRCGRQSQNPPGSGHRVPALLPSKPTPPAVVRRAAPLISPYPVKGNRRRYAPPLALHRHPNPNARRPPVFFTPFVRRARLDRQNRADGGHRYALAVHSNGRFLDLFRVVVAVAVRSEAVVAAVAAAGLLAPGASALCPILTGVVYWPHSENRCASCAHWSLAWPM